MQQIMLLVCQHFYVSSERDDASRRLACTRGASAFIKAANSNVNPSQVYGACTRVLCLTSERDDKNGLEKWTSDCNCSYSNISFYAVMALNKCDREMTPMRVYEGRFTVDQSHRLECKPEAGSRSMD